jgi:carbonic anhydrase
MGNLGSLLKHIYPAIDRTDSCMERNSHNKTFVKRVTRENIRYQKEAILQQSDILREMVREQQIGLIGALYDLRTGKVQFYDDEAIFSMPEAVVELPQA